MSNHGKIKRSPIHTSQKSPPHICLVLFVDLFGDYIPGGDVLKLKYLKEHKVHTEILCKNADINTIQGDAIEKN